MSHTKPYFSDDFITKDIPGEEEIWEVVRGFYFADREGHKHSVPSGTISDGASIPRAFWVLVGHPRDTDIGQAAAVHDVMYREGKYPRGHADDVFDQGMKVLGATWIKRKLVHSALSAFGWVSWNKYREKEKA